MKKLVMAMAASHAAAALFAPAVIIPGRAAERAIRAYLDTPTAVADIIVPEIFNPYYRELSTKSNAFWASGLVQNVDGLNFGENGGALIQMPYFKALSERAQLLDDTTDLAIKKIATGQDVAVQHARAIVYGSTDLAKALAGADPMAAIGAGIAGNWSMEFNLQLIATLKGATAALLAESPDVNSLDISGLSGSLAYIDGDSFVDAGQTLGDAKFKISAVGMHSATEAWLRKNDMIDDIPDSEGKSTLPFFQGKRVIVDDDFPVNAGVYDTFLFGEGAVGFGEGSPKVPTEDGREPLLGGGQSYIVTRRHYVLHPRGIKWDPASGVPALLTPSDTELEDGGNWARVWDPKNVRIILLRHKIG